MLQSRRKREEGIVKGKVAREFDGDVRIISLVPR